MNKLCLRTPNHYYLLCKNFSPFVSHKKEIVLAELCPYYGTKQNSRKSNVSYDILTYIFV